MSDFKTINIGNAGTSIKFGGNDLDIIGNLLNGQVAAIPDVKIKSTNDWGFWDNVLYIRNQADTQQTTIRGGVTTGSYDLFIPPLTQNDTIATLGLEQIFSVSQRFDKGIIIPQQVAPSGPDLPGTLTNLLYFDTVGHLCSISNTGTVTDYTASVGPGHHTAHIAGGADAFVKGDDLNASSRYLEDIADPASDFGRFWLVNAGSDIKYWDDQASPVKQTLERQANKNVASGYCPLDSGSKVPLANLALIGDAQIVAHTSTKITITNLGQLPATLVSTGVINIFSVLQKFDAGAKFKPITTPATDAAYGIVFVDSADSLLKYKRPNGTVDNLSSTANAPTAATYLTISNDATLTNERAWAAGDGIVGTDGGANSTLTVSFDRIGLARTRVQFVEDFFADTALGSAFFKAVSSGTGAQVTNLGISEVGVYGAWQCETGTTTTGRAAIQLGGLTNFSLGQGIATWEAYVKVPTLSTAGEEFMIRIGFMDSVTGGSVDGCYFIYDRLTSVNWKATSLSNSVSTNATSTIAVAAAWVRLKIVVNAGGTSVSFFVNGTEISGSPITTNIPIGAGRETSIAASIIKSAGSTTRTFNIDYIAFDYDLTSQR